MTLEQMVCYSARNGLHKMMNYTKREAGSMLQWLQNNLANIVIVALLAVIVIMAILQMVLEKKKGRPSCGGNCSSCGACASCKPEKEGLQNRLIDQDREKSGGHES